MKIGTSRYFFTSNGVCRYDETLSRKMMNMNNMQYTGLFYRSMSTLTHQIVMDTIETCITGEVESTI